MSELAQREEKVNKSVFYGYSGEQQLQPDWGLELGITKKKVPRLDHDIN